MADALADTLDPRRIAADRADRAGERGAAIVEALNAQRLERAAGMLEARPFASTVDVLDQLGLDSDRR